MKSRAKLTQVHLVSIEVSIIWATNTLVQTEGSPRSDFDLRVNQRTARGLIEQGLLDDT